MNLHLVKKYGLYFLCWFSITSNISLSQMGNINLKQLFINQGLPGVTIQDILQDKKSVMWFGIESVGLCKYDGHNFFVYQNISDDTTSISNNYASALCEDNEGYIWVGTRNGLNQFDRNTGMFTRYLYDANNASGISHNLIWDLKTDANGNIWVATEGGVDMFNKASGKFIHYLTLGKGESQKNRVICLYIDKEGRIWAGTRNYGIYQIVPKEINADKKDDSLFVSYKNWKHNDLDKSSIRNNEIRNIIEAGPGKLWIGTLTGLDKFDILTGQFQHISFDLMRKSEVKGFIVSALCSDDKGNLWIGTTNNGLIIFDTTTSNYNYLYNDPYKSQELKSNSIRSIIMDQSGLIWIGTKFAGLQIYDKRQEIFPLVKEYEEEGAGLNESFVLSLLYDSKGVLWIGTKGGGLNKYDEKTNTFKYYPTNQNSPYAISSNRIECIGEDENANLWLATENGLDFFERSTEHFFHYGSKHIRNLLYDNYGNIWLGTTDGLFVFDKKSCKIREYSSRNKFFSDSTQNITKIYQDPSGILWFGTYQTGIYEYNPLNDELNHFIHEKDDTTSISGDMIRSVYEDRSGRVWIGTLSDGLNRYDREKHRFTHFKTTQGLGSNTIYTIVEDIDGNLWMGTHDGISSLNPNNQQFENYNIDYGLQGKIYEINAACVSENGEVFLGGSKGYNHFFPANLVKPDYVGPMSISTIKIYDKVLAADITEYTEFHLSYRDNYILIDFSLLEYNDPTRNEYAYKLEGLDDDFIYSGNRHFTSYTSLPPGEYIFTAKGANPDKNWNEKGVSIKIIIPKPFWKKWWFIVLIILLGVSVIISIYIIRVTSIQKQQMMLEEKVKQKTKDLRDAYNILEEQKQEIEKRNKELTQQSKQINLQNVELEQHRNRLEQLVKERTRDLESAKEKAEESDHLKSAFLANMSHEIRTPLNAIVGFADVLANENLDDEDISKYNSIIQKNSITLLQLIDDIIDISKIEAGQLKTHKVNINLNTFLLSIIDTYTEMIEQHNKEVSDNVEFVYNPDIMDNRVVVYADKSRLKQVFNNLLSNAVKFTRSGNIELGYTIDMKKDKVVIFVKDTGIGIEQKNFNIIFDRFRKIENNEPEIYRGTGIGLSITKNLVELMGGNIWVESELGKGSIFNIALPIVHHVVADSIDQVNPIVHHVIRPNWEGKTILIVEDEESNFLLLETILFQTKAMTIWARSGEEGLKKYKEYLDKLDIVLLDIELPGMKGTRLIKYLKELNSKIPVIAQTAYAMQNDEQKIMKKGFDGYIVKPFTESYVYSMLSKYL